MTTPIAQSVTDTPEETPTSDDPNHGWNGVETTYGGGRMTPVLIGTGIVGGHAKMQEDVRRELRQLLDRVNRSLDVRHTFDSPSLSTFETSTRATDIRQHGR